MSTPQAPIRIQRSRAKGWKMPAGAISVTRPGRWGNPFTVAACHATLDLHTPGEQARHGQHCAGLCVDLYRESLQTRWQNDPAELATWLAPLRGKDLACWCRLGQACHADVLLAYANNPYLLWHRYDALARLDVVNAAEWVEFEELREWLIDQKMLTIAEAF